MNKHDMLKLPITRDKAKEQGIIYFFTEKECVNGHIAYRYTKDGKCSQCVIDRVKKHCLDNKDKKAKYYREHYLKNKNRITQRNKKYYKENINFYKEYKSKWYDENKERLRLKQKEYSKKNCAKIRKKSAKWKEENPEKTKMNARIYSNRRRAKITKVGGEHTKEQIIFLLNKQKNKCQTCKSSIKNKYHIDHIIPIALNGSNDIKNIQLLCAKCNQLKGAKHPIDWAKENGMLC